MSLNAHYLLGPVARGGRYFELSFVFKVGVLGNDERIGLRCYTASENTQ
jgi:hypothetical protein